MMPVMLLLVAVASVPIGTPSRSGAQPLAYVVNSSNNTVSVIDTEGLAVVATIPVGAGAWQLAVAPDQRFVHVTNLLLANEGAISVISTAERRVVKQIQLARSSPDDIVVSPCGRFLYVTQSEGHIDGLPGPTGGILLRVNVASSFAEAIPLADVPLVLELAPDGGVLYAATGAGIFAIEPFSGTVLRFIQVPGAPRDMVVTPDGALAYVTDVDNRSGHIAGVRVIDLTADILLDTIPVAEPGAIALAPDASTAYVTAPVRGGQLYVIDTAGRQVVDTLPGATYLGGVTVSADGARVYMVVAQGGEFGEAGGLRVIDARTRGVIGTVALDQGPVHIALVGSVTTTPTATTVVPTVPSPPTPTLPPEDPCPGDCDEDDEVTVDEVVTAVRIARDAALMDACPPCDVNRDRHVTVDELIAAVRSALTGCAR
jgi:YVTN family beta-propeller protein